MGIYYFSDYYVARQEVYKSNKVYFKRFVYDLISMLGLHLFYIEIQTLEMILRKIYQAITHNFEAGKVFLRRVEDVRPAFTEAEFNEAIDLQKKDEVNNNKLHLSISDQRIANTGGDSKDIVVGLDKKKAKRAALRKDNDQLSGGDDDDDGENSGADGGDLFSGLLGNGEEDMIEMLQRKKEEKKKLVAEIEQSRASVKPFVYSTSLIKEDPLKALQLEEKREKNAP